MHPVSIRFGNVYQLKASNVGETCQAANMLRTLFKRENIPSDFLFAKNKKTNSVEKVFFLTDEDALTDRLHRNRLQKASNDDDIIKSQKALTHFLQDALTNAHEVIITKQLLNDMETAIHGGYEALTKKIVNSFYQGRDDNILIDWTGVSEKPPESKSDEGK